MQTLNLVVRHVQVGNVDVGEGGRIHRDDLVVRQRQRRQVLT